MSAEVHDPPLPIRGGTLPNLNVPHYSMWYNITTSIEATTHQNREYAGSSALPYEDSSIALCCHDE